MTEPLPHDLTVAGPITLTLYAAIDRTTPTGSLSLKDVGPDVSVRHRRAKANAMFPPISRSAS